MSPEQMVEITGALKTLFDSGFLGPRAASRDNPMLPQELLNLVWYTLFGKSMQECDTPGAVFVFGMWKDQPLLGWSIKELPRGELVSLLAMSVAMIGRKSGKSIIPEMIAALQKLQERDELEQDTEGGTAH